VVKQHIVLEGDISSAMNPPSGCALQTRCRYKNQVPGNRCEIDLPPIVSSTAAHDIRCHLDQSILDAMKPVISFVAVIGA
jgi:peptide/nickel transport system ATP-binding protein